MIVFILFWCSVAGTTLVLTGVSGYIVLNSRKNDHSHHTHDDMAYDTLSYGPFYEAMREKE